MFTKLIKIEAGLNYDHSPVIFCFGLEGGGAGGSSNEEKLQLNFAGLAGKNILRKKVNLSQDGDTKLTGPEKGTAGPPEKKQIGG